MRITLEKGEKIAIEVIENGKPILVGYLEKVECFALIPLCLEFKPAEDKVLHPTIFPKWDKEKGLPSPDSYDFPIQFGIHDLEGVTEAIRHNKRHVDVAIERGEIRF